VTTGRGDSLTHEIPAWLTQDSAGLLLALYVQPGARRDGIVGLHGDRLKVAIAAPPVDGRANDALLAFLADRLGVRKSAVMLVGGETSRPKRIRITGRLEAAAIASALAK
jgi:uncharacterized protein (TIGR00251 family)